MTLSLRPRHLARYKDIAVLFLKYGNADFTSDLEPGEPGEDLRRDVSGSSRPEELADDLEAMGPTYVKLGQLLSSRADLLPEPYLKALARLQDKVKPFAYAEVEQIVVSELGVRISKAFSSFDSNHLAAASLGQVHRAALRDGRPVVVKVQRPEIRKQIAEDFEVLEEIALFFDEHTKVGRRYQFAKVLEEFKTTVLHELDYQQEAANLSTLAENLREFERIQVPLPIADFTTRSVLTMDYIRGTKITALSPLARLDLDGDVLAEELFKAYLKQILVDGFFHADPHPGNIFLTDGGRVALLDLGMVGRVSAGMQETLLRLLIAISEGNGDEAVDVVLRVSETTEHFKKAEFHRRIGQLISEQREMTLQHRAVGTALLGVVKTAADTGLYVPSELAILGKTLLQLEQVGQTLCPTFDPNAAVRRNVGEIMRRRMIKDISPGKMFGSVLEMKEFVGGLPRRVNRILDAAVESQLQVNIKTPDAQLLVAGFEKIANRITTGVILAALIVGAALLMRVSTSFEILGYPGLAMLCFMAAGGGGTWLIVSTFVKDRRDQRKPER